jgi:hypothetical protein
MINRIAQFYSTEYAHPEEVHRRWNGTLHIQVDDLLDPRHARGVSVSGNNMLLDPRFLFPPPYKEGRLTEVAIQGDAIVQTFGTPPADAVDTTRGRNYVHIAGGSIRFERLEMRDSDLTIVDRDGGPWFDLPWSL